MTTEIDTDWDVEEYRTKFESEEHWALKRDFMLAHKESFPEERLICLAQAYVNIELLRCRYPKPLMDQVSILAKEISKDYKKNKSHLAKRKFVAASDAANSKVKGMNLKCTLSKSKKEKNELKKLDVINSGTIEPTIHNKLKSKLSPNNSSDGLKKIKSDSNKSSDSSSDKQNVSGSSLSRIVLRPLYSNGDNNYGSLLNSSLGFSNVIYTSQCKKQNEKWYCTYLTCKSEILGEGEALTSILAKRQAARNAVENLMKVCYMFKTKQSLCEEKVTLDDFKATSNLNESNVPIEENNIGAKLLKSMGWSGGGLGKTGSGIVEPVKASETIGRSGLGLKTDGVTKEFITKITSILKDYAKVANYKNLVFSSDFSQDQRKKIHTLVMRHKGILKSQSYGKDNERHLVISRKIKAENCFDVSSQVDKYQLAPPGTYTLDDLLLTKERTD